MWTRSYFIFSFIICCAFTLIISSMAAEHNPNNEFWTPASIYNEFPKHSAGFTLQFYKLVVGIFLLSFISWSTIYAVVVLIIRLLDKLFKI